MRTLKLINKITEKGIDESFYFNLNGKDIYIKGANFIPSDSFVTRAEANNTYYL